MKSNIQAAEQGIIQKNKFWFFCFLLHMFLLSPDDAVAIERAERPEREVAEEEMHPKLSPFSRLFLLKAAPYLSANGNIQPVELPGSFEEDFPVVYRNGIPYVSGLMKTKPSAPEEPFVELGITTRNQYGNIRSVELPAAKLQSLSGIPELIRFDLDKMLKPDLELSQQKALIDSVHRGSGLYQPFRGEGVITGTIDIGIDLTHPTLLDSSGTRYRVDAFFDKPAAESFFDSASIVEHATDNPYQSHGAHVSGAVSGASPHLNGKYAAGAPESDMVLVGTSGATSQILDGVNHIFSWAEDKDKPAVANISWGSSTGPRDGTGMFSQVINDQVGEGRIVVNSAGNSGNRDLHIEKGPGHEDSTLQTFMRFRDTAYSGQGVIDMWGEPWDNFEFYLIVRSPDGSIEDVTNKFSANGGGTSLEWNFDEGHANMYIVRELRNTFNNRPNILLIINNESDKIFELVLTGTDQKIYAWNAGGSFTNQFPGEGAMPDRVSGSNARSIGDGAAGERMITVGAYSRDGTLADFSSRGPTLDGRVKPDITGLGDYVVSSVNSFDSTFLPGGHNFFEVTDSVTEGEKHWYYAGMSGTSMSAPVVSGIIALMLQADPLLNPDEIKEIFRKTSISDTLTGPIPPEGSTDWGHGKINAQAAVKKAFPGFCFSYDEYTAFTDSVADGSGNGYYAKDTDCRFYLNPQGNGDLSLTFSGFDLAATDTLYIYRGAEHADSLKAALTGREVPPELTVSGGSALLHFVAQAESDSAGKGWNAHYCIAPEPLGLEDTVDVCSEQPFEINAAPAAVTEWTSDLDLPCENCESITLNPTADGWYFLNQENSERCILEDSLYLTVNPSPDKPELAFYDDWIISSHTGVQWFRNGVELNHLKGQDTIENIGDGIYHVKLTNEFGCSRVSDSLKFSTSLAAGKTKEKLQVSLYPNPASASFRIDFASPVNDPADIRILDMKGRTLKSTEVHAEKGLTDEISTESLSAGYYIVDIQTGNASVRRMLIIR